MRLDDINSPESKVLKGNYASRDEQREKRPAYRVAIHRELKPIPEFKTDQEEADFWDNHSSTDYIDWSTAEKAEFPNLRGKKNTRKWCKGKAGREHDYDLADMKIYKFWPIDGCSVWLDYRCTACNRKEYVTQRYIHGELQA